MNIDTSDQDQIISCEKHIGQPILWFDQSKNQPLCPKCIDEQPGITSMDKIQQLQQEIISKSNEQYQREQNELKKIDEKVLFDQQYMNNNYHKIREFIQDTKNAKEIMRVQFVNQIKSTYQINILQKQYGQIENQQQNHEQTINIINKQYLEGFQEKSMKSVGFDQVSPQYYILRGKKKKEDDDYTAFAFNKENTILIISQFTTLRIYQFNNGEKGQNLFTTQGHDQIIKCLYFMKQSNDFVSGSLDKSIVIWKHNGNQWIPYQKFKDHKGYVSCLLMNKNEDLLISGSKDKTVKFWKKVNDQWSCHQTLDTDNQIFSISLNKTENKLISCGIGKYIIVMEINHNKQWFIKQKIQIEEYGYRLCFTFENQFVFQPQTKEYLEVYDYDDNFKKFYKQSQILVQSCKESLTLLPCQWIDQLRILLVKHGEYLNIFRLNEKGNYELIQIIKQQGNLFIGTATHDGQYLITSDKNSIEYYIKRLDL